MRLHRLASCFLLLSWAAFAQGAVGRLNFANYVQGVVDAPVWNSLTQTGPGAGFTAELYLVELRGSHGGSLTPLIPTSTFLTAGVPFPSVSQGRYWEPQIVDVPGSVPGDTLIFMVRVWPTSLGSFDAARFNSRDWGESALFTATLGGETPGNLVNLQAFAIGVPEPGVVSLCLLGVVLAAAFRKRLLHD